MNLSSAELLYVQRLRRAPRRRRRTGWLFFLVGLAATIFCFKAGYRMHEDLLDVTRRMNMTQPLTGAEVFFACGYQSLVTEFRYLAMAFSAMAVAGLLLIFFGDRERPHETILVKLLDEASAKSSAPGLSSAPVNDA